MYKIEAEIRGKSPDERQAARQVQALPQLKELHTWLHATVRQASRKSAIAGAVGYTLSRWEALTRYCKDGRIEIDNNAAERALRGGLKSPSDVTIHAWRNRFGKLESVDVKRLRQLGPS